MTSHARRWDRLGICASTACTIHCLIAPFLFLLVPKFASVWSHPASHALVALVVVPMALSVLRSGYRTHGKTWVMASAILGIGFIVVGSVLPYLGGASGHEDGSSDAGMSRHGVALVDRDPAVPRSQSSSLLTYVAPLSVSEPRERLVSQTNNGIEEQTCHDPACHDCDDEVPVAHSGCDEDHAACDHGPDSAEEGHALLDARATQASTSRSAEHGASCCPQVVIDEETGERNLVFPAASIVTMLGSLFLVIGHIGNLLACRAACRC